MKPSASPHLPVRKDWLARVDEPAIDPQLAIVDAHHHLWDRPENHYLLDDYLDDIDSGHRIVASVYVQCRSMFNMDRPEAFQCVGEVEFANGIAALSASGLYGPARICGAIVAGADLRRGQAVVPVLEEMLERAGPRLQGIRNVTAWHADPQVVSNPKPPPSGILMDTDFRKGVNCLKDYELTLDVWSYHTQLEEVLDLASSFPNQMIVLNHVGGPVGVGPYAGRRDEVFAEWSRLICQLANCPNVRIKLGGLGMNVGGFDLHTRELPPDSDTLAALWRPYILHCIDAFGVERCMFESNFPVDKGMYSYGVMWNAFKKITANFTAEEKRFLFSRTAVCTYNLMIAD
ncbi:amidohydrolase family protein [Pseudomonas phytophila]|uniref:Amidohydrolase family protein n=1 Tax=Pseudomonas phytophila TaxID=2867264 RepID=A0ABY6FJ18_9PSED|nr:amidohydrolase family protein [Pseudomonas phytophila]UXZ97895.1 amidohydrolase family protein [Pseudomonas phytophila]